MQVNNQIVLATLLYADFFDYPLTIQELYTYQIGIGTKKISEKEIFAVLSHEKQKLSFISGYVCLKGRERIISLRETRKTYSDAKLVLAKKVADLLRRIPTVELIGVSGSLAMENAKEADDIDLFFICAPGSIWITRLLVTVILSFLKLRRKRKEIVTKDTICTNLFLDGNFLEMPSSKQNLYIAHEIVQMKPLFAKQHVYETFLGSNRWVRTFLPTALEQGGEVHVFSPSPFGFLLQVSEYFARNLQLWYMKNHRTIEVVTTKVIAFHPEDYTMKVLTNFTKRSKQYGISL